MLLVVEVVTSEVPSRLGEATACAISERGGGGGGGGGCGVVVREARRGRRGSDAMSSANRRLML